MAECATLAPHLRPSARGLGRVAHVVTLGSPIPPHIASALAQPPQQGAWFPSDGHRALWDRLPRWSVQIGATEHDTVSVLVAQHTHLSQALQSCVAGDIVLLLDGTHSLADTPCYMLPEEVTLVGVGSQVTRVFERFVLLPAACLLVTSLASPTDSHSHSLAVVTTCYR